MKYITSTLITLSFLTALMAQDGISFEKGKDWSDLLAMAKASDKLIFMDAYTTWCGPCKKMTRDIFPQKVVGDYYNENFISVKIDMEKGEGISLAEKYNVRAYPTLLYINGDGDLIHRMAGYMEANDLIDLGKQALDPSRNLVALDKKYKDGNRDADFLRKYTEVRYGAADGSHGVVADEYLKTQDDWGTEENMRFIMQFVDNPDTEAFDYLVKNREKFNKTFGAGQVTGKIQNLIYMKIYYAETQPSLPEIEKMFQKYFPADAGKVFANFKMSYYRQLGDREGYANAAIERFKKYKSDDYSEYNEAAWTFYEVIDDPKQLKKALKWARKSVKMANRYENNDTVAHLYHKLGKNAKAIRYANKAIAIAKADGEDYGMTQELLEKARAAE